MLSNNFKRIPLISKYKIANSANKAHPLIIGLQLLLIIITLLLDNMHLFIVLLINSQYINRFYRANSNQKPYILLEALKHYSRNGIIIN